MRDDRCDQCGRFAGATGVESYDDYQPVYWNGPVTTFLCPACDAKKREEKKD